MILTRTRPNICLEILIKAIEKSPRVSLIVGAADTLLAGNQLNSRLNTQATRLRQFLDDMIVEGSLQRSQVTSLCNELTAEQVGPGRMSLSTIGVFLSLLIAHLEEEDILINSHLVLGSEISKAWKKLAGFIVASISDSLDQQTSMRKMTFSEL